MKLARHHFGWFVLAMLAPCGAGCVHLRNGEWVPVDWCNPGPAAQQQLRADVFDPYSSPDMGPDVVGGRPRDFDRPREKPPPPPGMFGPSQIQYYPGEAQNYRAAPLLPGQPQSFGAAQINVPLQPGVVAAPPVLPAAPPPVGIIAQPPSAYGAPAGQTGP